MCEFKTGLIVDEAENGDGTNIEHRCAEMRFLGAEDCQFDT